MKINWLAGLLLCCGAALCAFAVEPSAALFENNEVKVSRALEKPHVKASFHDHKVNRVMVYLQGGRQRFEYQDGKKPVVFDWKAGQAAWSPAEGMHSPEVVSDEPFNIIEVELKKPGGGVTVEGPSDPVKLDGKHYKTEFENAQVRVLRVNIGPHENTPMVEFTCNSLAISLTDEDARTTDATGAVAAVKHRAGEVSWETPAKQKLENAGDKSLEMLLLEIRD